MNKRFAKIQPQLTDVEYGAEPSLFDIIVNYYTSHGIQLFQARKLATDYVHSWVDLENKLS